MLHWLLQQSGRLLSRGKLSILIYHQVLTEADPMRPSEPTAEVFDWQMRLLGDYFTPLSLDEALAHLQQNTLPANAVCGRSSLMWLRCQPPQTSRLRR